MTGMGVYNVREMIDRGEAGPPRLMEYVKALENRPSAERGRQVLAALEALGIEATVQECRWPRIKNIIVDFSPGPEQRLLFSAHYDAVKGSPAANDNASGVAVLLGLCHKLRQAPAPVRIVFFDREEAWFRTPLLRLGLLGSLYYVLRNDLRRITAVYNLELCGTGDFLGVWPVKGRQKGLPAVRAVARAAGQLKLDVGLAHIPWPLFSGDHLSFRLWGLSNAVTLSLLPLAQRPALERLASEARVRRLLLGRRPEIPEVLSRIHTAGDTSSRLNEGSLRLMLSVLVEVLREYSLAPRLS
jgi:hypothetical protein